MSKEIKVSDPESLGNLIRTKRKEMKLTQQELAGASGTGLRFISELEQGKSTCQIGKIMQVLEMLGVELHAQNRNVL